VSELNGNPYLSKDRLTRVRNSIYFNNAEDYLSAASSNSMMLLGLGSDCGVFFLHSANLNTTSAVKAAKRKRCCGKKGSPSNISAGGDSGTWWVGRVHKIRKRVGTKWGICRNPVDLLNKPAGSGKKVASNYIVMVLLNWFQIVPGHFKYKYTGSDSQWIDLEAVISIVSMTYNSRTNVYMLDDTDAQGLEEFVRNKN
jgi:hypothetical protein